MSLQQQYEQICSRGLSLDMSRGKPGADVISLANGMLALPAEGDFKAANGFDCRNYGILDGLPEAKELFAPLHGINPDNIIIGGNSSLQMMYDTVARAMLVGVGEEGCCPWGALFGQGTAPRFLCPVPGYDRHFAICEAFGIEMLSIPTDENGPNMDAVEKAAADDENIKGIWCVPMYANPTGITYSDEVVRRLANMKTAAKDFRIFWDNAYGIHHLNSGRPTAEASGALRVVGQSPTSLAAEQDKLTNIFAECEIAGNPERVYGFASTSKMTFPGAGLAIMGASAKNAAFIREQMAFQTIGSDKLNQLRHLRFFGSFEGIVAHMAKIEEVLRPKFNAVIEILVRELGASGGEYGAWHSPKGGYFISFTGNANTAKRTVQLCKDAGVILTNAGATFPYGKDPDDANIRIAPTFPSLNELREAMEVFCVSVKLANV
ncbi:MAG: aminotransferase class I/II-fold pyridoxal phosphate-dependent enzyme [Oscillospiraceae bacterium]|nr:aminotransferase class I/II-fold pyridoxal phosphate-dependent enzyme [Oscillospiraceae bacterium]